ISDVSTFRGEIGAIQENRLEADIRSLSVERENLLASESAIRDTDFAEEVVSFTRNKILTQANASRQSVLRLLGPGGSADGGGGRLLAIT
ncbi:MAG: flagellin, partial [Nitrospinota bacterium]|nr:flagellin [Nitrospinota bacterium]